MQADGSSSKSLNLKKQCDVLSCDFSLSKVFYVVTNWAEMHRACNCIENVKCHSKIKIHTQESGSHHHSCNKYYLSLNVG